MKKTLTLLFLALTISILKHPKISLFYALTGLTLWYSKMVPALLPFMILSGIMIRMRITEQFTAILYPIIHPLFRVSQNVCYAMSLGFLCGFPMGAKTVADLFREKMISRREASYLLAFCNQIGPVYFISYALPLLHRQLLWPYLFAMYGIPLLYGLLLRYTIYRDLQAKGILEASAPGENKVSIWAALDESINSSVQSILSLGGYMILFNLLNILPHILLHRPAIMLMPFLEITGGISMLKYRLPIYTLLLLVFGGLSCIAQTYNCIKNTPLSILTYTLHKVILTVLTGLFFLFWWFLFPDTFLS